MSLHSSRFSWLLNPAMLLDRWRSFLRLLKSPIDSAAFHLLRIFFSTQHSPSNPTLLLLRIDGIGDFLFFAQYLGSIREAYKGFRVVLVCRQEVSELANHIGGIDEVIPLNAKFYQWNYLYRIRFLRDVRSRKARTALYLSYHRRHIGDEIALLSGASEVVAFSGNNEIMRDVTRTRNNSYYSDVVEVPDHVPEGVKYQRLFEKMGIPAVSVSDEGIRLTGVEKKDKPASSFAVIAPGSTSIMRRWPPEGYAEIADAVATQYGLGIVLCGDGKQRKLLRMVSRMMKGPGKIVDDSSLMEVVELIKNSRLFIGNDSGLLHVAATFKVPAVGIIGGGHFSRYFPYGNTEVVSNPLPCFECNWKCRYRKAHCVADITTHSVMAAVKGTLSRDPGSESRL